MACRKVEESSLTAVADAIRAKAGTTEPLEFPQGFVEAVEDIQDARFYSVLDRSITEFVDDKITTAGAYAFHGCKLTKLDCPNITTIAGACFMNVTTLKEINIPKVTTIGNNAFQMNGFTFADFHLCESLGTGVFKSGKIETLILRKADAICTLANADAFNNTPIANGTGYIYVPSALVDSYKTATNWSTFADRIRSIEDYPEITGGATA